MFDWLRDLLSTERDIEARLSQIEQDMSDLRAILAPTLSTLTEAVQDNTIAIANLQETQVREIQVLEGMHERLEYLTGALPAPDDEIIPGEGF